MKRTLARAALVLSATAAFFSAHAAPFGSGNIVVSRVGTGSGALAGSTATAVFLDEYTPAGVLVQSVALPVAANGSHVPVTVQGTSSTEGIVTRSDDGSFLVVAGYSATPGTTGLPNTAAAVPRAVALIDAQGNIDSTTRLGDAFSGQSVRSAATFDGNEFWLTGGSDGIRRVLFGNAPGTATTVVSSSVTNNRVAAVVAGQLYMSSASGSFQGVNRVGSGLPSTSGNTAVLIISAGTNASQFALLDLDAAVAGVDTAYVANNAAVQKFRFNGTSWAAAGSITSSQGNVIGVTAVRNGSSVEVYGATATSFVKATDAAPAGSASGAFALLASAGTNRAFRGVAPAPVSGTGSTPPTGTGSATPNTLTLGQQTLLQVAVNAGTNPASTGITVRANLSAAGGNAAQAFFDDGTNGDVTAADGVFSYRFTPTSGAGPLSIPVTISDAQARSSSTSIALTISNGSGLTLIHTLQGAAEAPVSGSYTAEGIVTARFTALGGFFMQEEDAEIDGDPATSEAIFVESTGTVQPGQKVQVTGTIGNTFGLTRFMPGATVAVQGGGAVFPLPAAVTPELPAPAPVNGTPYLERFEGMRVSFPGRLYVTDNYNLGRFGEISLSPVAKLFTPTNGIDPNDAPAIGTSSSGTSNVAAITAQTALNERAQVILDDGSNASHPNPIPFLRSSASVGGGETLRLGDSTTGLSGILSFDFSAYRILPAGTVAFEATNPRPTAPPNVGGNVRVAGSNVLNYFITFGGANDRGADSTAELARQKAKIVAGLKALNSEVVALSELQNNGTGPGSAVDELLNGANGLNAAMTAAGLEPYAAVATPSTPFGTDAIQVGIIYQPARVSPVGNSVTDSAAFSTYSRPPLAQLFAHTATGARFWVIANHFKSKGAGGAAGADLDQGDGQSAYNFRRKNQASALIAFINNTLVPADPDVLVMGDLNAYGEEDPIDLFRSAGFIDLLAVGQPNEEPYSYLFDGLLGRLDHALATPSLAARLTGAIEWHVNSVEPRIIDYNLDTDDQTNPPPKPDDRFVANSYRFSDHDPILTGFNLPTAPLTLSPNYGRAGSTILLTGAQAGSATQVTFAGGATASFTVVSGTQISVTVPTAALSGPLTVTTPGGSLTTEAFRLLPKITSFTPTAGKVGSTVTINGAGFTDVQAVKFADNLPAAFSIISDTQIVATVPAGAVRGSIRVEAPGGSATSVSRFAITP